MEVELPDCSAASFAAAMGVTPMETQAPPPSSEASVATTSSLMWARKSIQADGSTIAHKRSSSATSSGSG